MENNQMTVKEVLIDVNRVLAGIKIPVTEVENIGIPVSRAISGIQLCINAFMKEEMAQKETEKDQAASKDDDIEIEEVGVVE